MENKRKHKALWIVLAVIAVIIVVFLIGGWFMFGGQIRAAGTVKELEDGVYCLEYKGDYGFDEFLAEGGAKSDEEMADYITSFLSHGFYKADDSGAGSVKKYGCSTLSAKSDDGGVIFGRNFDEKDGKVMIVHTVPKNGYESVSTCDLDYLGFGDDYKPGTMMNNMMALSAVYVPLDGMNSEGLCVADLMAGDDEVTAQDTGKPSVTTVSGIRLMLDHAATTDEAVELLKKYDMHSSIGSAHHYSITDASGKSVVVEYVSNEMIVKETKIVTNFYLTDREKAGVGSDQSHTRFETLEALNEQNGGIITTDGMRDALESVCQARFPDSDEISVWSIVYDDLNKSAYYYLRQDFGRGYKVVLGGGRGWISAE